MNEKGVEALVAAGLSGRRQVFGAFADGDGLCALGVLREADQWCGLTETLKRYGIAEGVDLRPCPLCGLDRPNEMSVIVHMNDEHHADFLTIARKLGPDTA